jgi:formylglycine-generating enzyme required for sulfatase activity
MTCDGVNLTSPTVQQCPGYRLPTQAEWQYAARAGTRTAWYSGDPDATKVPGQCFDLPVLSEIAWYCANSEAATHPVALKRPNQWLLYDMFGNANEWGHNEWVGGYVVEGPLVDPWGEVGTTDARVVLGSPFVSTPSFARAAVVDDAIRQSQRGIGLGLRPVRTLL